VHQVGFVLNEYIEMHGQQNIKYMSALVGFLWKTLKRNVNIKM